jgi:tetratricopeptide (TPR) repeat protein
MPAGANQLRPGFSREYLPEAALFNRIALLVLLLSPSMVVAQAAATAEQADKYFRAQDWKAAAAAYEQLTQRDSANGRFWLRLGVADLKLHNYQAAVPALEHAEKLGFYPDRTQFELAIAHAGLNQHQAAIDSLSKAVAAGFSDSESLDMAEELAAMKGMPEFDAIHQKLSKPCESDPAYHALDFWVGKWEVRDPNGELQGHNDIVKMLNACAIQENWSSTSHHDGKSLFYYDVGEKKWKQVWITDDGNMKEKSVVEHYPDGGIRFLGIVHGKDGSAVLDRTTLTPLSDGRVRQVIEQSVDNGKTWGSWEGIYSKQK